MLISHRKRFIYTKTAKTGGTSIEVYFEPYCMPENEWTFSHARDAYIGPAGIIGYRGSSAKGQLWYNHLSAREIKNQIGAAIWDAYFKFCVIRNPFDRMVSAFHFANPHTEQSSGGQPPGGRPSGGQSSGGQPPGGRPGGGQPDTRDLARRFREWLPVHGKKFLDRNKYTIDGKLCVDYVIRYEQMDKGVEHVCHVLGVPFEPERIPHLKGGLRPQGLQLSDYYDAKTIDFICREYQFEIDHFGYVPPTRSAAA